MTELTSDMRLLGPKKPAVSFGTAAFILIRVKRAFKKKKMRMKSAGREGGASAGGRRPSLRPLLRSRTLPSIVVPTYLTADLLRDGTVSRPRPSIAPSRPLITLTTHDAEGVAGEERVLVGPEGEKGEGGCGGLGRLARMLTGEGRGGEEEGAEEKKLKEHGSMEEDGGGVGRGYRRRTHSLERRLHPPPHTQLIRRRSYVG